jgi:hypothetical protein
LVDDILRRALREYDYRILVIRYDRDLFQQIRESLDIFGGG